MQLAGREVGGIGLGLLPLAAEGRPDYDDAIATVRHAVEVGVPFLDTADCYGLTSHEHGYGERLAAAALATFGRDWPDRVLIATKGGLLRGETGGWINDARPEHLVRACDASLQRLGLESIPLYQLHRPDPAVPIEESVGTLAELRRQGKIQHIGISNFSVDMIERVRPITPIGSVQNRLSLFDREELATVAHCQRLGIAFLAWGPLGGRRRAPRLAAALPALAPVAARHRATPHEIALAWLLAQGPNVVAIPGCTTPSMVDSARRAAIVCLSPTDLAEVSAAVAVGEPA
ncbi:aldo/keto reductase [Phytohabitans sp. ZYX-F-186]|uniref:Aldo/keto reductase n=1 Tax=Phytohabitans maris TaxID=3071409 RepID=A0ABU0ZCK1_9ACTN|nr:aldo/keto reductase [Phytohabitans sp. ZYX-F-186]MDQ7904788.1 aldo/keto reductase [Phytohabitans sp. ZYX-F-186]